MINLPSPDFQNMDVSLIHLGIQSRRKSVNKLRVQGYTNQEIAKKLDCSLSTVEKINQHIRTFAKKWYDNESISDFCESLSDSIVLCDYFIEDLQILYQECDDIESKLKISTKISEFEEKKVSLYSHTYAVQEYLTKNQLDRKLGDVLYE